MGVNVVRNRSEIRIFIGYKLKSALQSVVLSNHWPGNATTIMRPICKFMASVVTAPGFTLRQGYFFFNDV